MTLLALVGETALLGIAAAFTPLLLALQLLVCSGDPWRARARAVALGGALAFGLVGGLLFFGFAQLPTDSDALGGLGAAFRIVGGIVLVGFAWWLFRPHRELSQRVERDIEGYVARASTPVFFGVAFVLSIKDLSSFVVLAPALHDIATAGYDVVIQTLLLVLLYVLALLPVLAPPIARRVFGHRADVAFQRAYRFAMDHQFQLVGGMAAVIAVYLIVTGALRLLS